MAEFFDVRAEGYDEHMKRSVESFETFYAAVADGVGTTDQPMDVLDLGAGTGLQIEGILERSPKARITAIDLSEEMLSRLRAKYASRIDEDGERSQIRLVLGSFLDLDLGRTAYDRAVSVMALHHWFPDVKGDLYRRIFSALRPGGLFVHGDYVVDAEESRRMEALYHEAMASSDANEETLHHLDIPLTLDKELELLDQAGFDEVRVQFQTESAVVYIARKAG